MANPHELVDIVDPDDKVLYQIEKQAAHNKGLLHRTIIAELIDEQGNWTLVKQSDHKQDSGQFVSPVGGHIQAGESELLALERESLEEIGIKPVSFSYVGKAIFNRKVNHHQENHYFIVYEIYSNETPTLNDESVAFKKFSPKEIESLMRHQPELFGDAFHFVHTNFYSNSHL
jgi:isopentenyl-diphosphate Delta-isomerase